MRHARKKYLLEHGIPALLSAPLGLMAAACFHFALELGARAAAFLRDQGPAVIHEFEIEGLHSLVGFLRVAAALAFALLFAGFLAGLARKPKSLPALRACCFLVYALALLCLYSVSRVTEVVAAGLIKAGQPAPDSVLLFLQRWEWFRPAMLAAAAAAALHLLSYTRAVINLYSGRRDETPAAGDLALENLRTHGRDPRFRKSVLSSAFGHFAFIILIPLLLRMVGCVEPYLVPEGSGNPVINIVQVVKPKKKPKKKFVLNPQSAISFHIPDLDDSKIMEDIEQETQLTYKADPSAAHARMGAGGGKKGGWPDGMKNAKVRFIRIQFDGPGWDDGMDPVTRADLNFLEEFERATGFRTSRSTESHSISKLADYPPGFAPPFVYLTGRGHIRVSGREVETLRRYILDGGMLFVSCASPEFHRNFQAFISALFPGEPMLVIPDDDPIFQYPYTFPNGAPPLWHHGGRRSMGIRRGTRWAVFYHPGDIHDAWKRGHSGVSPEIAKSAMQMGINIIYHAFTHYLQLTRKHRKK